MLFVKYTYILHVHVHLLERVRLVYVVHVLLRRGFTYEISSLQSTFSKAKGANRIFGSRTFRQDNGDGRAGPCFRIVW